MNISVRSLYHMILENVCVCLLLPCQVCKNVNVIKHRKPYKNVYFGIFL